MKSSKEQKKPLFVDLFESLNSKKRSRFRKLVESPYFNTNKTLGQALECLENHPKTDYESLKTIITSEIFDGISQNEVTFRLLWSDLLQLFKSFTLLHPLEQDETAKDLAFVQFLRTSKKDVAFETQALTLRKKLVPTDTWNPEWYQRRYALEREIYSFESSKNRFTLYNFKETSEYFEVANLIKRLRAFVNQLAQEAISSAHYAYPFIQEWIQYAKENQWSRYPEINMYLLAITLYQNEADETNYENYLGLLKKYESQFDYETSRELHIIALNYSIRRVNNSETKYYPTVLHLFQTGANQGWLLDNGIMTSFTYKNIISLCIRMEDVNLATDMLNRYKNLVHPKERNSIYNFNLSRIYKEQKEYKKALYLLNTSVFKDPLIELSARVEMIKIYYEIQERELVVNQINATKSLLKRSKKLGYQKEFYVNFLTNANKLVSQNRLDHHQKNLWIETLKREKLLTDKTWILSMVEKMPSFELQRLT